MPFSSFSVQCHLGLNPAQPAFAMDLNATVDLWILDNGRKLVELVATVLAAEQYQNFRHLYGTVIMARAKQAAVPRLMAMNVLATASRRN